MKFLLDENFPKAASGILKDLDHESFDFRGTRQEGMDDYLVFEKAQQLNAVLLTTDRDFFHTVPHLFPSHSGVIVIALRQPNRKAILERLEWVFSNLKEESFTNRVFQFRDSTWLCYPPMV